MASFGQLLRQHRRQCQDPQRGGPLTQERLGELLGQTLGDAGYSGAAVSEWERDKSKIDEDNRPVLVGLIGTLRRYGGLASAADADSLLHAGNYRALNAAERGRLFPDQSPEPSSGPSLGSTSAPPYQPISKERRKQLILLRKVRAFWVEGVLEKSMPGEDKLAPHYRRVDDVVARPWDGIVDPAALAQRAEGQESPLELYKGSDRSLLILGEPGAGKTMMLLSLASALTKEAELDPLHPIPVVLNLVTWVKQRQPLEKWAVEELAAKYMIPRRIGRRWLEDNDLTLLLDGFDDVPKRQRRRCGQTINAFRSTHGLCGIVVCSRSEEYAAAGVRLKLGTAVELQPLQDEQIENYLAERGQRLEPLRSAVARDDSLRAMAHNPLMLSIMNVAYDDTAPETVSSRAEATFGGPAPLVTRRQRLFGTYVNRMFRRRVAETTSSREQMTGWLSWLASQMTRFQQSPFLLEQIQPSWLASRRWRWFYLLASGLIAGLFTACIIWMLLQILSLTTPQLGSETAQWVAFELNVGQGKAKAIALIALNMVLGLAFALIQGRYFEAVQALPEEPEVRSWHYRRHLALVAVVIGGLTFVVASFNDGPRFALAWATVELFIFVIITRYVFGVSYNSEIRTVESLGWSWPSALRGLAIGLLAAVAFEFMEGIIYENNGVYLSMAIPAAGGMVLGGLRGRRVESKSRPNQGIVLSFRNSFVAATLSAVILTALALYVRKEAFAVDYALRTGILTFMVAGALFGGGNVVKHYLVRLLLWLNKDLPWNVIRFLDDAADLVFLRKVGGGYIFIHRLLQQYFASIHQPDEEAGAGQFRLTADRQQMTSKKESI